MNNTSQNEHSRESIYCANIAEELKRQQLLPETITNKTSISAIRYSRILTGHSMTIGEAEELAKLLRMRNFSQWVTDNYKGITTQTTQTPEPPKNTVQKIPAQAFLERGIKHMQDRASERDKPDGERSMLKTVNAFNAIYNKELTEEQGWMFMVLLKTARSEGGDFVKDDYEDGCSYFGLAGECASVERD